MPKWQDQRPVGTVCPYLCFRMMLITNLDMRSREAQTLSFDMQSIWDWTTQTNISITCCCGSFALYTRKHTHTVYYMSLWLFCSVHTHTHCLLHVVVALLLCKGTLCWGTWIFDAGSPWICGACHFGPFILMLLQRQLREQPHMHPFLLYILVLTMTIV